MPEQDRSGTLALNMQIEGPSQTPNHYPARDRKVNQRRPGRSLRLTSCRLQAAVRRGRWGSGVWVGWVSDDPFNGALKSLKCGQRAGSPQAPASCWGKSPHFPTPVKSASARLCQGRILVPWFSTPVSGKGERPGFAVLECWDC